ncbi:DUF4158 domain-containing protein [Paenibacillus sp. MZ03-122A]|uniref:DUF4158 domain-containing protein n=1 Tax=Paenibacillus sp. MZ03-122A TaxID=2962033 RepID=UPI0020B8A30C|nr:DUF4158 domain-containing protein [Paenibacillus sp. MZ03-122A]MCP3779876.1 DUF4158 domain-containing protein [Paenibacillus sp. MZ03-122A]
MKRNWELDELIEHFTFLPNEMQQMGNKSSETRIGFAFMFKFFQYEHDFSSINLKNLISYIAKQIEVPAELYAHAFFIIHNKLNQTKNALNSPEFTLVERKST